MGTDDRCGICGDHYQHCKHYIKLHIPNSDGRALCGRRNVFIEPADWFDYDVDPQDYCKNCVRRSPRAQAKVDGQVDFDDFEAELESFDG